MTAYDVPGSSSRTLVSRGIYLADGKGIET